LSWRDHEGYPGPGVARGGRALLSQALREAEGNRTELAKRLGMHRHLLLRKCKNTASIAQGCLEIGRLMS
jgi:DNA-binding NtrC family response regulator